MLRMRNGRLSCLGLILVLLLTACSDASTSKRELITVFSTSAAFPWLELAYDCTPQSAAIVLADTPDADLALRVGEPPELHSPAFQLGTDDLLIVTNPGVGIGPLTRDQAEAIFAGQVQNWTEVGGTDLSIEVWAFASQVDVQEIFDQLILRGRPVSSFARLAVTAQHMSDSVGARPGAVGLLPRRWKAGNTREALQVAALPVLAITSEPPRAAVRDLLACMQAGN